MREFRAQDCAGRATRLCIMAPKGRLRRKNPLQLLLTDIRHGRVVFWIGAGVSMWPPTGLPNGPKLKEHLLRQIFITQDPLLSGISRRAFNSRTNLGKALKDLAPEAVAEAIYRISGPKFLSSLLKPFREAAPNAVHRAIAHAATASQRTGVLVSTNYDTCLERIVKQNVSLRTVRAEDEVSSLRRRQWTIIKPHGCAMRPKSVCLAISAETRGVPQRLATFLRDSLERKVVCFVGYSASEPDLYPLLLTLNLSKVYVVAKSQASFEQNEHLRKLRSEYGGHVIFGIRSLVGALDGHLGVLERDLILLQPSLRPLPRIRLSHTHRRIIAVQLLAGLNFCTDAIGLAEAVYPFVKGQPFRKELLTIERGCRRGLNEYAECRELTRRIAARFHVSHEEQLEEDYSLGIMTHHFDLAEEACKKLLKLPARTHKKISIRTGKVYFTYQMARLELYKIIKGEIPKSRIRAIRYAFDRYRKLAQAAGDLNVMLEVDRHIGRLARVAGKATWAVQLLKHNLEQWRILGRRQGQINCLRELGMAQYVTGDIKGATATFVKALKAQRLTGADRFGQLRFSGGCASLRFRVATIN